MTDDIRDEGSGEGECFHCRNASFKFAVAERARALASSLARSPGISSERGRHPERFLSYRATFRLPSCLCEEVRRDAPSCLLFCLFVFVLRRLGLNYKLEGSGFSFVCSLFFFSFFSTLDRTSRVFFFMVAEVRVWGWTVL